MTTVLLGDLGHHARGKTLVAAVGAGPGELPPHGVALAFSKEAQQQPDRFRHWVDWAREPGRVLVLMPPFERGACEVPTAWEARRADPLAGGEGELGRVLARERRHELRGELVPWERAAGQVITGLWRRHPNAGLVVITALPLWSLLILDHRPVLSTWLDDLLAQAGMRHSSGEPPVPDRFEPTAQDWTLLLHLCSGPFADGPDALDALAASAVFRLDAASAGAALQRLTTAGWVEAGRITDAGMQALTAGPFSLQARALTRMSHG